MTHTPAEAPSILGYHNCLLSQVGHISCTDRCKWALRKSIRLVALALALLPATAVKAQGTPTIQWELVNPFRFIHDQETVDELKNVYAALRDVDKTASGLERELQKQSEDAVTKLRDEAKSKYDCEHTTESKERRQCFEPYAGWFATLAEKDHAKTCWDSKNHRFRNDGPCKDYVYPKSHRVRVWITNAESLGDNAPQWLVQPAAPLTPCDPKYGKRFCIDFDVPYHAENPEEISVAAQFPNLTLTTNPNVQVRDKLIVGLGDSFAAGEGNPDIPAQFIDSRTEKDGFASWLAGHDKTSYPTKDKGAEAAWLDRRCHRSMYSYQFKTALQLALSNPHEAITYVTFSCSGAVTTEIVNASQKAHEGGPRLKPQLQALRQVLQNGTNPPRQIDYLLLSTGGNDIGFASYVAYILLRQPLLLKGLDLVNHVSEIRMKANFDERKFERDLLGNAGAAGNYTKLQKALLEPAPANKPNWIRIKGCEAGKPCDRIVLTPYPNVLTDESGNQCKANRLEFDESFGSDDKRVAKIETVRKYVFEQIRDVQRQVETLPGWTLIDGNITAYLNHGFCARNALSTSTGEKFQIPTWVNEKWTIFDPRDYRAYQPRSRWFRLPVDAKLTTDQRHDFKLFTLDIALEDVRSNIMHPTAEGLAKTADLNVEAVRKIETTSH